MPQISEKVKVEKVSFLFHLLSFMASSRKRPAANPPDGEPGAKRHGLKTISRLAEVIPQLQREHAEVVVATLVQIGLPASASDPQLQRVQGYLPPSIRTALTAWNNSVNEVRAIRNPFNTRGGNLAEAEKKLAEQKELRDKAFKEFLFPTVLDDE